MSSRNVAVQTAVYEALLREKRAGESFTELFRRLLDQKGGLEELFGAWGKARARGDHRLVRSWRAGSRP